MKPTDVILIGAGARGTHVYGDYASRFPHKLRYVAVAEPDEARRKAFAEKFSIPPEKCFASWEDLIGKPKMAEAAFIVTMDRMHFGPAIEMLKQGYHVIVEKPMAIDPIECIEMVKAAKKYNRILSVGHVLRFTPFYREIANIVQSGMLGDIVNVTQMECVGFWHFAQSYVRMNWARAQESAPSIMAKCCHDLDIIRWLVGAPVKRLSSVGNLFEFRPEKAPGPVPQRCTDGCPFEAQCPYSAFKLYIEPTRGWLRESFKNYSGDQDDLLAFLKQAPQSQCVYLGRNDVCDQQIVAMEFENQATATLTMMAHTNDDTRTLRISGTRGELHAHFVKNDILVRDFITGKVTQITPELIQSGHMGGDIILIDKFLDSIHNQSTEHLSSVSESLESHLLATAAEISRTTHTFVTMSEYIAQLEEQGKNIH